MGFGDCMGWWRERVICDVVIERENANNCCGHAVGVAVVVQETDNTVIGTWSTAIACTF
jgi:hypothetical protein